jgi:Rad3-related DNA helicase
MFFLTFFRPDVACSCSRITQLSYPSDVLFSQKKQYILLSPTLPPKNTFLVLLKAKNRGVNGNPK